MNLRKKLKQLYLPNFFKWAIILIISSSCSTNVGQIFKEEPEKKETSETHAEITPEIAESYKVQEVSQDSGKKIKKKEKSPKKHKQEVLPEEIAKLYEPIDKSSEEVWKSFTPYLTHEEEIVMKVAFFGVTVGFMKISVAPMVEIKNTKAYHLIVKLKSADFYSFIYSLDNVVESFIDEKKIIPLKYIPNSTGIKTKG